jgi:galactokinase
VTRPLKLGDLLDPKRTVPLLVAGGMRQRAAADQAAIFAQCAKRVQADCDGQDAEARALFVPGRIEVLGKHTDYAGGRSLISAVERGLCLVAAPCGQSIWRVRALDVRGSCEFPISADIEPAVGHWANYPMTVVRRVARNFPQARRGATVAYAGDLPRDAGMSSSSTVMVANFLAMSAINDLPATDEYRREIRTSENLAEYLGTIENGQSFGSLAGDRGVGTFGGSEDHLAMLCSRAGKLAQYSYCPVRAERTIDMPQGWVFVAASCGVAAAKTGSARRKYNRAGDIARAAVGAWNQAAGRSDAHLAAALASEGFAAAEDRIRAALAAAGTRDGFSCGEMLERFEHFLAESQRIIPAAGDALAAGDLAEFGRQVETSQRLAEQMLHNQVPQTVALADLARQLGAVAASAFGAGFGGSVWALIQTDKARDFMGRWSAMYADAFGAEAAKAKFFITAAGPAAFELKA